jgi:hypothetical protein
MKASLGNRDDYFLMKVENGFEERKSDLGLKVRVRQIVRITEDGLEPGLPLVTLGIK